MIFSLVLVFSTLKLGTCSPFPLELCGMPFSRSPFPDGSPKCNSVECIGEVGKVASIGGWRTKERIYRHSLDQVVHLPSCSLKLWEQIKGVTLMQARLRVKGSSGTAKKSSCTASKNSSACCEQERPGVGPGHWFGSQDGKMKELVHCVVTKQVVWWTLQHCFVTWLHDHWWTWKRCSGEQELGLGMEFLGSVPMACPWPCTQPHMAHVIPLLSCAFSLCSKVKPTPLPSNSETNEFKRQVWISDFCYMTPLVFQCMRRNFWNAETHYCKGRCHIENRLSKGPHGTMLQRSQKRPGSQNFRGQMWISQNLVFIKDSMPLDRQAPDTRLKMVARRVYIYIYRWYLILYIFVGQIWGLRFAKCGTEPIRGGPRTSVSCFVE